MPNAILIDATTMEELRRDAARYRFLRDMCHSAYGRSNLIAGMFLEELDNAIDRVMSAPQDDEQHDRIKAIEINDPDGDYYEERQIDNRERAGDINKER